MQSVSSVFNTVIVNAECNDVKNERSTSIAYTPPVGIKSAKMILSDTVSSYEDIETFNHISEPVLHRMIAFAKDPSMMDRMLSMETQYKELQTHFSSRSIKINDFIQENEIAKHQTIDAHYDQEIQKMTTGLNARLEMEIQAIQNMYTRTMEQEKQKLQATFNRQKKQVHLFFQKQHTGLMEMHERSDTSSALLSTLKDGVQEAKAAVEEVFGVSEYLLPLLLLSEDYEMESLRDATARYLSQSETFTQFMFRRELDSSLILDTTVIAILQHLPDKDLNEVTSFGKDFKSHLLATNEMDSRALILWNALKTVSNTDFRRAIHGTANADSIHPIEVLGNQLFYFPQVRSREAERRREFSRVLLDATFLPKQLSLSEDRLAIQVEAPYQYLTARATRARSAGEFGKWLFEITIDAFELNGSSIIIGFDVHRKNGENTTESLAPSVVPPMDACGGYGVIIPGITPDEDRANYGITWQSDAHKEGYMGIVHANGRSEPVKSTFQAGDVIGVTLDQDSSIPTVRFYLNGKQAVPPLCSSSLQTLPHTSSISEAPLGIAIASSSYSYSPTACLYVASAGSTGRVRFNFRGNFDYPIPHYEPFGADLSDIPLLNDS